MHGRTAATPVLAVLLATALLAGCGSPTAPVGSGTTGTVAPGSSGPADGSSAPATGPDAIVAGISTTSIEEAGQQETAVVEAVAEASGLSRDLGPGIWDWVKQVIQEETQKVGDHLVLTGDAALVASLDGGPPQVAANALGAGYGLFWAAATINLGLQGAPGTVPSSNGTQTTTQTTTANGETTTATVSFNIATTASGSTVEADVTIGVGISVADAVSGTVKRTGSLNSHGKLKLDFCPDVNGKVRGHVTMNVDGGTSGVGSVSVAVDADIEGTVDEGAFLTDIDVSGQSTQATTGTSGGPSRTTGATMRFGGGFNRSGTFTPNGNGATGQGTGPADLTDAEVNDGYAQIVAVASIAIWVLGDAAQKKWRGGACVEIRSSQQSRDVRKNETVQFETKVWHKFDKVELDKKIINSFSGTKSVDPVDMDVVAPVTNSFKAGPREDDTGTIEMTTTSNRGIGTLTLTFRVRGGWIIDTPRQHGEKCGDPPGEWKVEGTYSAGGFDGDQAWTMAISRDEKTGRFVYTTEAKGKFAGVTVFLAGSAKGTVTLDIDPSTGIAHMHVTETKHTYKSTTTRGGQGIDQDAPLEAYDFDWLPGGNC